ncbi:MAG: hypothetical protein SF028_05960 [Candidatus Sumerlaeia bacterium]|nr:hypothetical protein [Candidatus Sumerlaeia bacterium]
MSARDAALDGAIASAVRTRLRLAKLWLRPQFRRDGLRLLRLQLGAVLGWHGALMLGPLALAIGYLAYFPPVTAQEGYVALARFYAALAILLTAPIYASEQRQGTFELLWLATGSQQRLVATKATTLMVALGLAILPGVAAVSVFLDGAFPAAGAVLCLLLNSLFVVGVMAWLGTFLVQAWAGGLLGACLLAPLFYLFERWQEPLNFLGMPTAPAKDLVVGRVICLVLSLVLLGQAAGRLRKALRG